MNKDNIYSKLTKDIPELKIYKDEPMTKHTSFKIGGNADIFIKATSIDEIKKILEFVNKENVQLTIIGNGSNILVKDNGIRGITMQTSIDKIEIEDEDDFAYVYVSNGVKLGFLASILQKKAIAGFEFASGIPGSIGGAIRMNAGAYGGEFKDIIEDVTFITRQGEIKTLKNEELDFSYRHSRFCKTDDIILLATLKLPKGDPKDIRKKMNENMEHRKEKQPTELPSAGSTFKRGEDFISAKLIDDAGLKGYKIGGAKVSEKHAGFVVNDARATAQDVIDLIDYIKRVVYDKFGKLLEEEIEIIGE